jgi:hypothetical protein
VLIEVNCGSIYLRRSSDDLCEFTSNRAWPGTPTITCGGEPSMEGQIRGPLVKHEELS